MGFLDFLNGIDEIASDYVGNKSLEQLYQSIVTDSTTSAWAVKELKSRLRQMSNRELKSTYYDICDCYDNEYLISIVENYLDSRGISY